MIPAQILDEVIRSVSALLLGGGYKKSARSFVSIADGVARVIQFRPAS